MLRFAQCYDRLLYLYTTMLLFWRTKLPPGKGISGQFEGRVWSLAGFGGLGRSGAGDPGATGISRSKFRTYEISRGRIIRLVLLMCRYFGNAGAVFRPEAGFGGFGRSELKVISHSRR